MAGESARASAKRLREKAERQARVAAMFERGAEGEEATAAALAALPAEDWTVFHDLRWPGRKFANVDHVVVGPGGVFVIDSKNWTGSISVTDNVLRQNGRVRETAVHGAAEAALAVSGLARSVTPLQVHPVICFVRDEPVTGWARDVMLCSTSNLVQMLTSREQVLTPEVRRMATLELDAALRSATAQAVPASTPRPRQRRHPQGPVRPSPVSPYRSVSYPSPRARHRRLGCIALLVGLVLTVVGVAIAAGLAINTIGSLADGSAQALGDGSCPLGHPVKAWTGETGQKLYREPDSQGYDETRAQTCYVDAAHATSAGYVAARPKPPTRMNSHSRSVR